MLQGSGIIKKTKKMRREEERLGKPLEEIIPEIYKRNDGDMELTASEMGLSMSTLYQWIPRLGLRLETRLVIS